MNKICPFFILLMFSVSPLLGQNYTWTEDIACILYENCVSCHYENGIAPFSLISYEDASQRASLIATAVNDRYMPPWPADPNSNHFLDERVLSETEIEAISSWVEAGAPSGDLSSAPSPPIFESNEVIQQPDLVIQLPEYISQATTEDDFRCFVIPSEIYNNRFIQAIEFIPGNSTIVHHALIFLENSDIPKSLDDKDPTPGYSCFGGIGSNNFKMIGGWVPGMPPIQFPAGMGMFFPANVNIVVQLHYPAGSQGESDQTKINFKLSEETNLREITISSVLNHGETLLEPSFFIPANTIKRFNAEFFMPIDITILGIGPHMHLVGQSIKAFAVTQGGFDTLPLINIPRWDFDWQGFYNFRTPVIVRSRSTLHAQATYDNTSNNPDNPNSPPEDVAAGQESTDEMMIVSLLWTRYVPGDENLVLLDSPPLGSPNCDQTIVSVEAHDFEVPINIFPNPVPHNSRISVRFLAGITPKEKRNYEIFDLTGKKVSHGILSNAEIQYLELPESLNRGMYFLIIRDENTIRIYSEKIIVF